MAKKIVNTASITREEWLELRKCSIGGSDAGAIIGDNPWSSPLGVYMDKKGLSKTRETSEAMRLGSDLEGYVAERFSEKTGKKVRNDNFMWAHDEYPFITANIDREVVGENAGLECKTMNSFSGYDLEAGDVPAQYYAQVQHYMLVKGYERMYLAILVFQVGVFTLTVERNDKYIAELLEAEIDFWKNNVEAGVMPAPTGDDMDNIKELYPKDNGIEIMLDSDAETLVKRYRELDKAIKTFKGEQDGLKAKLCAAIGEDSVAVGDVFGCSWKYQERRDIDKKKLKEELPKIYEKYEKVSGSRVFRTKELKKKQKQ